jgi:iron complex outermembrane receptor protein
MDASPRNIYSLRSSATLVGTQVDLWLRHTGQRAVTSASPQIEAYTTLDAAFSWRLPYNLEVALVGKDLLERRHSEIVSNYITEEPVAVERSAYVKLTWTY